MAKNNTIEKNNKALATMKENNTLAIVEPSVALRARQCSQCLETIESGSECTLIRTRKQLGGESVCRKCWAKTRIPRKWAKFINHENNENADNVDNFVVSVATDDENLYGYLQASGFTYGSNKFGFVGNLAKETAQQITPILDSIFTSSHKCTVTCNNKVLKNTEDFRDAVNMKVRNAVVNKSVK